MCEKGYCIPIPNSSGSGGSGNMSTGGTKGDGDGGSNSGGVIITGGTNGSGGSSDSGGTSNNGDGGENDPGSGATSGSSNNGDGGTVTKGNDKGVYGLATGGGGCGCKVVGAGERARSLAPFMTALLGFAALRRRRNRVARASVTEGGVA
jgi:MYXO-CTERM domain-containing protein